MILMRLMVCRLKPSVLRRIGVESYLTLVLTLRLSDDHRCGVVGIMKGSVAILLLLVAPSLPALADNSAKLDNHE